MQFGQETPTYNHHGEFCPYRGWLDEYENWRGPDRHEPMSSDIAPFEAAIYRYWNEA